MPAWWCGFKLLEENSTSKPPPASSVKSELAAAISDSREVDRFRFADDLLGNEARPWAGKI
jgi:hypothetical protein